MRIVVFFVLFISSATLLGNTIKQETRDYELVMVDSVVTDSVPSIRPKKKGVAIALAATLGVFGVHRLYLGTAPKTPVIYTLTLGGGFGALMVADIVAIITCKDVNKFSPSDKVFMWAK